MSNCESCSGGSCGNDKDGLPPGILREYDLNQSTADGSVIWLEVKRDGQSISLCSVSKELIGKMRSMSDSRIFGVIMGDIELKPLYDEIFSYGVDTLYQIKGKKISEYHPEVYSDMISDVCNRVNPAVVLIGGTPRGREIAPRVAATLATGITADCTALEMDGRDMKMTRPAFGGNIIATISCTTYPQIATVRPGVFVMPEPMIGRKGTVIYRQYSGDGFKDIMSSKHVEEHDIDISNAKVLISLGNGMNKESMVIAEELARLIGAELSCSRALVEKGWFPISRQVGQSGRSVSPDLYLAFGISGSVQHKVGISSARRIISINKDADAPIGDVADIIIVGDANMIIKDMLDLVRSRDSEK